MSSLPPLPDPDRSGDPEQKPGDLDWLVDSKAEPSAQRSDPIAESSGPKGGYDLAEAPEMEPRPIPSFEVESSPSDTSSHTPRSRSRRTPPDPDEGYQDEPSDVSKTWTRCLEWTVDLLRLAVASGVYLVVLGLAIRFLGFGAFLLTGVLGILTLGLVSYPILITLERPVRITPEQAVSYYLGALSHARPHLRRMWFLLSDEGKESSEYRTYEEFQAFWRNRLESLRGQARLDPMGWLSPVRFELLSFEAPRGSGRDALRGTYQVRVSLESWGLSGEAPNATTVWQGSLTLSRGPDRMWYLDDGRFPGVLESN